MVGTGGARTELIPVEAVDGNTSFGAYANKFIRDNTGVAAVHATTLDAREVLDLKKSWYKLYAFCLRQINARFPPETMHAFELMQVLDPSVLHGPFQRQNIGNNDLAVVVERLLHIFEIPLYTSGLASLSLEEIRNSFVIHRVSRLCADLWKEMTQKTDSAHIVLYSYYRQLLQMPDLKPWALFALFVLVFPTGNAISERGFSAMGSTHTKQRSELSHAQVFAHLMIGFNGLPLPEFAAQLDVDSRLPHWPLYIRPNHKNI